MSAARIARADEVLRYTYVTLILRRRQFYLHATTIFLTATFIFLLATTLFFASTEQNFN